MTHWSAPRRGARSSSRPGCWSVRPGCSRCAASASSPACCFRSAARSACCSSASRLSAVFSAHRGRRAADRPADAAVPPAPRQPVGLLPDRDRRHCGRRLGLRRRLLPQGRGHAARAAVPSSTTSFSPAWRCVVLADDAYAFMVMWETMALSSFFLVTANHRIAEIRRAGYLYLLVAHVGAIGILLCFGVLQANTGDYTFANMRGAGAVAVLGVGRLPAGAVRLRRQGRHPAAARLAARGPSGCALAGLGADERGDAEDRDLRPAARRLRPAARAARGGGASCCWRSAWPPPCSASSSPPCRST